MAGLTRRAWLTAAAQAGVAATVDQAAARPLSRSRGERVRQVVRDMMTTHDIPGASVAVGLGGEIIFAEGFGSADLESSTPAAANTRYRTASIGKPMTAVATMALVQDGVLRLDDPVRRYCPRFPVKPEGEILVRHLLAHQSGIRHYTGPNAEAEQTITRHYSNIEDALDIFVDDPLVHAPGAGFTYSTWGYTLLGCVLQRAAGIPYPQVMQQRVFDRARMIDTLPDNPREIIERRAGGYISENGQMSNAIAVDMSSKLPAGGYLTTAPDLVRFAMAFQGGVLVAPEHVVEMTTSQALNDGSLTGYGYGWALSHPEDLFHGQVEVHHGGGTPGVGAVLYTIPQSRFALAIQANQESFRDRIPYCARIAEAVIDFR
jgi:CubicO group peptidase (beta-lactamase class C family)